MATQSEQILTEINTNVFFREFTFNDTFFPAEGGELELADNFIFLDDIVFIIQAKERDIAAIDTNENVDKWFKDRVLKKAKNQIKNSLYYIQKYVDIEIKNSRGHKIVIPKVTANDVRKIALYWPNSTNLSSSFRQQKFYRSQDVGNINLIELEDYYQLCKTLQTPAELNSYILFRERMFDKHGIEINNYPEQYLLSHFLYNPGNLEIVNHYIELLPRFKNDIEKFDISSIIEPFYDKIFDKEDKIPERYYPILKQLAKLNRHTLAEFKSRYTWMVREVNSNNKVLLPRRFGSHDINCGFIFLPLDKDLKQYWQNAIMNFTSIFKYKHKYERCIGITCFKTGDFFDIQWCYIEQPWEFDAVMDAEVAKEAGIYGAGDPKASFYEFGG